MKNYKLLLTSVTLMITMFRMIGASAEETFSTCPQKPEPCIFCNDIAMVSSYFSSPQDPDTDYEALLQQIKVEINNGTGYEDVQAGKEIEIPLSGVHVKMVVPGRIVAPLAEGAWSYLSPLIAHLTFVFEFKLTENDMQRDHNSLASICMNYLSLWAENKLDIKRRWQPLLGIKCVMLRKPLDGLNH